MNNYHNYRVDACQAKTIWIVIFLINKNMKNIDVKEEIRNFIKRFEKDTENNVKLPSPVSIEDMAKKTE